MQTYEGYIENGYFTPIGVNMPLVGRHRVFVSLAEETKETKPKLSIEEKRKLLLSLRGCINDPTFVEPPEIPWEHYSKIEDLD